MQLVRAAYRASVEAACALRFHAAPLLGRRSRYDIAPGYRHRTSVLPFDDTGNADEWQREVYLTARQIMLEHSLKSVCDVGCGSGYKLVHILGDFETIGIDLPETIRCVRDRYPERQWLAGSFEHLKPVKADLVVCADVIEHVADPDALMRFLLSVASDRIVMSTPDRDLVYKRQTKHRYGPPANPAHVREWSFEEFHRYVSRFLEVERHDISNPGQATQMIVGRRLQCSAPSQVQT